MNQIEALVADVEAELDAYGQVLDEYEQTLSTVEQTLSDSTLEDVADGDDFRIEAKQSPSARPTGAD